jgi:pyruvate/2-oxoacid:ferredoxin oxidoreductase beta subunit
MGILAAHRIPYAATASVAYPVDLVEKVEKAKRIRGTRFLHILSPCPPGWRYPDESTIEMARMAVRNLIFPLLEVENGERWRFTVDHPGESVEPYIRKQGRFRHLTDDDVAKIQEEVEEEVDDRWEGLRRQAENEQ